MIEDGSYAIGLLSFHPYSGELRGNGSLAVLPVRAGTVLSALCTADGGVLSRERLLNECWGEGDGSDEALTQAIAQIRRSFDDLGESPALLRTYPKRGYALTRNAAALPEPDARKRPAPALAILAVLLILLLFYWWTHPHAVQHLIRHQLGWGGPLH